MAQNALILRGLQTSPLPINVIDGNLTYLQDIALASNNSLQYRLAATYTPYPSATTLPFAYPTYFNSRMIGTPSSTACVFVMSDDTAQDSDIDENMISVAGTWGQAEANIVERIGGSCTIKDVYLNGGSLSDLPDDTLDGTLAGLVGTNAKG
jgi:hypothetical protein